MSTLLSDLLNIFFALVLVLINGFFVAVEFALVKLREGRLNELVQKQQPLAKTALWLQQRLDASLSACQLGITMTSLGLGWIGEPAIAHLLRPMLLKLGINTELWIHVLLFSLPLPPLPLPTWSLGSRHPKFLP
jgi:CBS domain containing-hemolysin-like protein